MASSVTAVRPPEMLRRLGDAPRLLLAGHPRLPPGQAALVHGPKDLLLALLAAEVEVAGLVVARGNPHFLPVADQQGLAVLHGGPLALACPVPGARNLLLLDGEDLLVLAEERMAEAEGGLNRRRLALMDAVVSATPAGIAAQPLLGRAAEALDVAALAAVAPRLVPGTVPVRWMDCVLETGPYNYLGLHRLPQPAASEPGALPGQGSRGALLGFATPATLGDLAPAMRAFAALPAAREGARFLLVFFGTPEELAAALTAGPGRPFLGDNFRCPGIRILFAPFDAAALLAAMRGAAAVIESVHGGVPGALAAALGVANRLVLGPDGTVDAVLADAAPLAGIDCASLLTPAGLARRGRTVSRAGERDLAALLERLIYATRRPGTSSSRKPTNM